MNLSVFWEGTDGKENTKCKPIYSLLRAQGGRQLKAGRKQFTKSPKKKKKRLYYKFYKYFENGT